jgi:hypothetical protein
MFEMDKKVVLELTRADLKTVLKRLPRRPTGCPGDPTTKLY